MFVSWLAVGCGGVSSFTSMAVAPPEVEPTLPPSGLPPAWLPRSFTLFDLEPGMSATWSLGDLDGDGSIDAIVQVTTPDGDVERGIVYGPLRDRVLPAELDVAFSNGSWLAPTIAEFTGEPPLDVVLPVTHPDTFVVPGPWTGTLIPAPTWTEYEGDPRVSFDLDGDGIADEVAISIADTLGVTFGPATRFSGPVDVTIDLCAIGDGGYQLEPFVLFATGDLDGDGLRELSVRGHAMSYGSTCGDFTVSVPAAGEVDPFHPSNPAGYPFFTSAVTIGDWNEDGLPEVLEGNEILFSPIQIGAGGLVPAERVALDTAVLEVTPTPFDLDADGQPELIARTTGGSFLVRSALCAPSLPVTEWIGAAWPADLFVDQGQAFFAYELNGDLLGLPLGPATAL